MMLRRAFFKRMALAAAACAFIDVPWPRVAEREDSVVIIGDVSFNLTTGSVTAPADVRAGLERYGGYHRLWISANQKYTSVFVTAGPGEQDVSEFLGLGT